MNKLTRHAHIAESIIFVDGISGSGKSVLFPILSSFENVEKIRIEHIYEYLSILHGMKKIDVDAAISLMRIYADLALYNQMISREVNLRINDDSGLLNNPHLLEYVSRLFYKDGEDVMRRIKKNSPILNIMTHQILPNIDLAFHSFEERLKVIVMVRHPLYMIDHWLSYVERYGSDPREFTLWIEYDGKSLPWFAQGWEEKYLRVSPIDKVILSIEWLLKRGDEAYGKLTDSQKEQVMIIPFEKFVTNPSSYLDNLECFLKSKVTSTTDKALKRQKVPRAYLSSGRGHKHYGWNNEDRSSNDLDDYNRRKSFVDANASQASVNILDNLCREYEKKYNLAGQSPWCFLV